jgi:hypothetical protein
VELCPALRDRRRYRARMGTRNAPGTLRVRLYGKPRSGPAVSGNVAVFNA